MIAQLLHRIDAFGRDNESGASTLLPQALDMLMEARRAGQAELAAVARGLCLVQPSMASIWNAAAVALVPDAPGALDRFRARATRAPAALARIAVDTILVPAGSLDRPLRVVTVSASRSVEHCLESLAPRCRLRLVCAEGRPVYEGRGMAARLAAKGIGVEVCTDAAVTTCGEGADAVLVGADAVTPRWFVNKCGTRQVAAVAAETGVPLYVVASRDKFLGPPLDARLRLKRGPTAEVWGDAPSTVTLANPYFERVSVDRVVAFITDVGAVGPDAVSGMCAAMRHAPGADALSRLVDESL